MLFSLFRLFSLFSLFTFHELPRLESRGNSIFMAWAPCFLLMLLFRLSLRLSLFHFSLFVFRFSLLSEVPSAPMRAFIRKQLYFFLLPQVLRRTLRFLPGAVDVVEK